ncbi:alpha-2,8-polysialyltransferase family protein [Psychrobacter sp. I-STPA6b]|uniref:alpha-2,8-polysialyltransferase family protein n=1 Tax=Psychrobacter sp. I-STPA6b TaxID=2585718 RepID=UPI001D0BF88E|nr:alpha-2,8-polysialyltransferase family protein [Psychrobacter sp. I-STPA6b]
MSKQNIRLIKNNAIFYEQDGKHRINKTDNLFVLTHLGQLKQMEALIQLKNIKNNSLVVLYTYRNLVVPQVVHDQYSSCFKQAIFMEIPFGVNKLDFIKLYKLEKQYKNLIKFCKSSTIYLNSFEGHYAILTSIAKSNNMKVILVEEGTATYKLKLSNNTESRDVEKYLDATLLQSKFMQTVGQTQVFKKAFKFYKYNKELYGQTKRFVNDVITDEKVQKDLIKLVGTKHLKASLQPFKGFDKVYASYPELIRDSFGVQDVDYFLIHEVTHEHAIEDAKKVIERYGITEKDTLYVSQRYHLDPEQYSKTVGSILMRITREDQKVFIKLHPKESKKVYDAFKYLEFASNGKFIVIEDSQFLIESVVKISKLSQLIGLTSTTLVYGSLISPNTKSISIANELIKMLPNNKENQKGIDVIKQHLEIIRIFENIEFR